jgi:hypothetical protein
LLFPVAFSGVPVKLSLPALCLGLAVLLNASGSAHAADEALRKAKTTFTDIKKKQDEQLRSAFEKATADATKAGKLDQVEALSKEQQVFLETGVMPSSPQMKVAGQKYSKAMKTAFEKVETAYEKAIKAETKAEHLPEAKSLQRELTELRAQFGEAAQDRELIEVVSATWAYDGRFGRNDGTKEDVRDKVQQLLKQGDLEIGIHTLGGLSGVSATKSLYAQIQAGKATLSIRLAEGSTLEIGDLSQAEAKADSFKIPGASLELLSAMWLPEGGGDAVDGTADYLQRLKAGPVEVSAKSFPNVPFGKYKTLSVTYRMADRQISILHSNGSMSSITVR